MNKADAMHSTGGSGWAFDEELVGDVPSLPKAFVAIHQRELSTALVIIAVRGQLYPLCHAVQ